MRKLGLRSACCNPLTSPTSKSPTYRIPQSLATRPTLTTERTSLANPAEAAWAQGYKTGLNGKPDSLCPFKKGAAYQAWIEGWQTGAKARGDKPV
jgi:ribosome modulation factor